MERLAAKWLKRWRRCSYNRRSLVPVGFFSLQ
jgi:hypothetical protein